MSPILPADEAVAALLCFLTPILICALVEPSPPNYRRRRRPCSADSEETSQQHRRRGRKKPQWVRDKVIHLAALNPKGSCRTIAENFRSMYLGVESVGKSFVATLLRDQKHQIAILRREIRSPKPTALPRNRIWALDLTSVPNGARIRLALGILDHGTRACIALQELHSKHSLVLLRELAAAVRRFGRPATIRTDNEAVFTSRLFRYGLALLGIRHQRTEKLAPWQNGRIERFFGTFKFRWHLFRQATRSIIHELQAELTTFRAWYNHVRPHQHLDGRVPAGVWAALEPRPHREHAYVSEWEEVLTGFHFR